MVRLTFGLFEHLEIYEPFFQAGVRDANTISEMLKRNQLDISRFEALLDFGCGCGRVLRNWRSVPAKLHGTDLNPYLIEWCQQNLPFGEFRVNDIEPPLSFGDSSFDFIYTLSVFTHIVEPLQIPWAAELARVLIPGGYLLTTVQGAEYMSRLSSADQEAFGNGKLIVKSTERAGTNACAAYHPEAYLRSSFASGAGLDFLDLWSAAAMNNRQDAVLFRKPC
jgi:SAM-dependent methyltransferase